VRSGVNGTPTFYVNGVRHDGSYELESLLDAVRRASA
jgi:protein-disulfide isomerase